jgi:FixJ family two-component response regulator
MTKTVMIVEDELFVALDLENIVDDAGFRSEGPYETVAETLNAVDAAMPECAILDVRLRDGEVFPVADRLRDAGVPFIFHSGHADEATLRGRYPAALICPKPSSPSDLRNALKRALCS